MALLYITVIFSAAALTSTAPLQCDKAVKPLMIKDLNEIKGKWILISGATDYKKYQDMLKELQSSWIEVLPLTTNASIMNQGYKMKNCTWLPSYMNLKDESGTLFFEFYNISFTLLETFPDCLLMNITSVEEEQLIHTLYFFGRSRQINATYLEEYQKQVQCLGLPPPDFFDHGKELCPFKEKSEVSHTQLSKSDKD